MEVTKYAPGTPSWVDVSSADLVGTVEFLRELFGWSATDMGEDAGHYTMFDIGGRQVAAAGPKMPGDPTPSAWTTYITVDDAAPRWPSPRQHGGDVLMGPMDVFDAGTMAIVADPSGGVFAVWQPKQTIGAQLVNEPNALCWNELTTRDADGAARVLLGAVRLGGRQAGGRRHDVPRAAPRRRRIAGCIEMDDKWPPGLPTHWMVYFAVDDCDATAARAKALGGTVHVEPTDIPVGPVRRDPGSGRRRLLGDRAQRRDVAGARRSVR